MPSPEPYAVFNAFPFNGPGEIAFDAIPGIAAVPYEGLWLPSRFAKYASLDVRGSISTLAIGIYGTNSLIDPSNTYTVTVGGSATAADVLTLGFANGNLSSGYGVAYVVPPLATVNIVAAGIAAAINADPLLPGLGFLAKSAAAVVTITFPSVPPGALQEASSPSNPWPSNATLLTTSLSGGATETLTVATGSDGESLASSITALGITAVTIMSRWFKARMTTLTGTNATITATFYGAV